MKKVATILILMLMGCAAIPAGGNAPLDLGHLLSAAAKTIQAATVSDEDMEKAVSLTVQQMDASSKVCGASDPYTLRLKKLVKGINDADGIPLNFKVYKTSEVNAFACPDGSVRVYTGIMDLMDDNELLGIIGHEVGHVVKRHSKKAFRNALLTSAARDAIGSAGGWVGALTDSQLGDLGEVLMSSKYSRKQEQEADDCGYDFLVANGRNPWAMAMAFEKMQQLENRGGRVAQSLAKMFSDHPDTADRIKRMSQRATADGYPHP